MTVNENIEIDMQKKIDILNLYLKSIKTSVNLKSLVSNISLNYNNSKISIYQISNVSVLNNILIINPWDKNLLPLINESLLKSGLNLQTILDSKIIKINIPYMSEERRNEILKEVKKKCDEVKIEIRLIRKLYNELISKNLKNKIITEDNEKQEIKFIQKQTDKFISEIDRIFFSKKKEILNF